MLRGEPTMDRFEKIYSQGVIDVTEIWVDKETGVQYLFHRNGNAAGLARCWTRTGSWL